MILLVISSVGIGGKEKRFEQLSDYLGTLEYDHDRFVYYQDLEAKRTFVDRISRAYDFYRMLFKTRPSVIHSWSSFLTVLSFPYAYISGVKLVDSSISTNGLDGGFVFRCIRRLAILLADRVTTNSLIAQQNLNIQKKSSIVRNGVPNYGSVRSELSIEKPMVWFVSRMEPGKRVDLFIEVAKKLNSILPNIGFKVVGDGSLLDTYRRKYDQYGFVEFAGFDSRFETKLKWGDVGVLISDSEGTPNVLLEFMGMAIPVVYWNRETHIDSPIAHGLTGFNVDSIESCVSNIQKLMNDAALYKMFSENSRVHMNANFNVIENFGQFLKIYVH